MGWPVTSTWSDALTSPHQIRWIVSSTLGDEVLADNLDTSDVSVSETWDGSQITREFKGTVADATRAIMSADPSSPLAPWGQHVQVRAELSVGSAWAETIPVGEFRIESDDGDQAAATLQRNGAWLFAGQRLTVTCRDMLQQLADETWTVPVQRQVAAGGGDPTVVSEMARVLSGTGLHLSPHVTTTATVPWSADYGETRLDSLLALTAAAGSQMVLAMDRAGMVDLIDSTAQTATWTFSPSSDVWVSWNPTADRTAVKNGVLVRGSSGDQYGVRGVAYLDSGPLRWGGPFGRVPEIVTDSTVYSNTAATAAAQTRLESIGKSRAAQVIVTAPSNPAASVLDTAVIVTEDRTMSGQIQAIDWAADTMKLSVQIPWEQVWHD